MECLESASNIGQYSNVPSLGTAKFHNLHSTRVLGEVLRMLVDNEKNVVAQLRQTGCHFERLPLGSASPDRCYVESDVQEYQFFAKQTLLSSVYLIRLNPR